MGANCYAHFELIRPFGAITGALNKSQITTRFRLGLRSAFRFGLASSNRNVGADQIHAAYRPQVPADGQIKAHSTPRKFFGCTLPIMVLQAYSTCLAGFPYGWHGLAIHWQIAVSVFQFGLPPCFRMW